MQTMNMDAPRARPVTIAPALNGRPSPQDGASAESTMAYTCVPCARRKVKCDKIAPVCSTCRKARLDCEYQEPAPRKRKRKPVDDVHERLEQYESILKQHGLLPGSNIASPAEDSPGNGPFLMTHQSRPVSGTAPGKLLRGNGKTRYIDSNLWRNLDDEDFHPSSDEEEDAETQPAFAYQPNPPADPLSSSLLSTGSPSNLVSLHPTYESAMNIWNIYVENIDPLVKIVHVPSTFAKVQRAASNPSTAPRALEALMFSVYHLAIMSVTEEDCLKSFGESQSKLIARYHDAARQALVNVSFLRTTNFTVVQAYVLFLLGIRKTYDPHTFWILTGVAIRIAQRMGLHRDAELMDMKPFDVQMRRRVFWQLLPLDGFAGQLSGTGIWVTPESWDVRQPLNVNDTDIWPEMTEPPESRTGATDIMFCLARTEVPKFIQKINLPMGNTTSTSRDFILEKDQNLQMIEEELETKYVRYCDFSNPLHNLTSVMCRGVVNSGRLRIRMPRAKALKNLPEEEKLEIWKIVDKMLDLDIVVHNNSMFKGYLWHLSAYFQWDPLVWILNEIRAHPLDHKDGKVWTKIEKIYTNHPDLLEPVRSLHLAVGQLTLKAWDAFSKAMQEINLYHPEPPFINTLRTLAEKRRGSQQTLVTPPNSGYNPFNPVKDEWEDASVPTNFDMTCQAMNMGFDSMQDFNPELDWGFWDSLIHDPSSFPVKPLGPTL